jgi:hypothetical protein
MRRPLSVKLCVLSLALTSLSVGVGCAAGTADTAPGAPGGGDDSTTYATLADFCAGRAKAECADVVVKACGSKTTAACLTARTAACDASAPQGTTYEAANAPACIAVVKTAYADATITDDEMATLDVTCGTKIFSGPGVARAPCTTDYDCSSADGLACVIALGATDGKCLAPHEVKPSEACPNEADVCTQGFFCDAKSKTCMPKAAEGQNCYSLTLPCDDGLKCPDSPFASGCLAKAPAGAACNADSDCAKGMCDKLQGSSEGNCTESVQLSTLDSLCVGFH